jgi:hypothetical protein
MTDHDTSDAKAKQREVELRDLDAQDGPVGGGDTSSSTVSPPSSVSLCLGGQAISVPMPGTTEKSISVSPSSDG